VYFLRETVSLANMPKTQCSGCKHFFDRLHQTVESSEVLELYQAAFPRNQVKKHQKFCKKCYDFARKKKSASDPGSGPSSAGDPGPSDPETSGDVEPSPSRAPEPSSSVSRSSDTGSSSVPDDPMEVDYVPPRSHLVPEEPIEIPWKRVVSTEAYCFFCGSHQGRTTVPHEARMQVFLKRNLFVPKTNRVCMAHLIGNRFYEEDLLHIKLAANNSAVDREDFSLFTSALSAAANATIRDRIGSFAFTDDQIKIFTGLTYEQIETVASRLKSMRNVKGRTIVQALVIFLFKLRTGNSNATVAGVFGLPRPQQVSDILDSVITSFEKDILASGFGFTARTREDLIQNETSEFVRVLHGTTEHLALIYDGTYIRHGKSANSSYQRKSYSVQKKVPLCKPFTICTTTGYVVDMLGPYEATVNDASIMRCEIQKSEGLGGFLRAGDVCFVDRGFRDVKEELERRGLIVLMPALKGQRKQLTTEEANASRFVTKIRWAVEAVHGIIKQKYRILDHRVDNDLLPKIQAITKIVCFLNNVFGKRLRSDQTMFDEIVERMQATRNLPNTLAQEVEDKGWNRARIIWTAADSHSVLDFPELTEKDLKIFFTGTYQLSQSVSYLAEMLNEDNTINLKINRDESNILRVEVRSRHVRSKTYRCYVDYEPESIGYSGIKRHYCECANGTRTVGCCSHVASVVYYLSYARYLSRIIRPAEILDSLFHDGASVPVINEDSDED
jgi:hypothetical protein